MPGLLHAHTVGGPGPASFRDRPAILGSGHGWRRRNRPIGSSPESAHVSMRPIATAMAEKAQIRNPAISPIYLLATLTGLARDDLREVNWPEWRPLWGQCQSVPHLDRTNQRVADFALVPAAPLANAVRALSICDAGSRARFRILPNKPASARDQRPSRPATTAPFAGCPSRVPPPLGQACCASNG